MHMQALQNADSVHAQHQHEHVECVNNSVCKNRSTNLNTRTCTLVMSALLVLWCKLSLLKDTYLYLNWVVVADLAIAGRNTVQAAKAIQEGR